MARAETDKLRLLAVDRIIRRGQKVTVPQIQAILEKEYEIQANRKAIYRDLLAIDRFTPIETTQGRNGGVRMIDVAARCDE